MNSLLPYMCYNRIDLAKEMIDLLYDIRPYAKYHAGEILDLYNSVGWLAYVKEADVLERAFEHSLLTLAAYEDCKLIGLIRTVGDGESIVFIQDLLVHPKYQRKGIGAALVRAALDQFPNVRQIQLTTDNSPQTVAFYQSLGFLPHAHFGCVGFMLNKQTSL